MEKDMLKELLLAPKKAGLTDRTYNTIDELLKSETRIYAIRLWGEGWQNYSNINIASKDKNFLKGIMELGIVEPIDQELYVFNRNSDCFDIETTFEDAPELKDDEIYYIDTTPIKEVGYNLVMNDLAAYCKKAQHEQFLLIENSDWCLKFNATIDKDGNVHPDVEIGSVKSEKFEVSMLEFLEILYLIEEFFGNDDNFRNWNPKIANFVICEDNRDDEKYQSILQRCIAYDNEI